MHSFIHSGSPSLEEELGHLDVPGEKTEVTQGSGFALYSPMRSPPFPVALVSCYPLPIHPLLFTPGPKAADFLDLCDLGSLASGFG